MLSGCTVPFCEVLPEQCPELAETGDGTGTTDTDTGGDGDGDSNTGDGDGDGDGDPGDGDGDPPCTELGCECDGSPGSCDDGLVCENDECVLDLCGNGLVDDVDEECDDGNDVEGDGCDVDCSYTTIAISTGSLHTCALIESGRVRCWGEGAIGALGYGNTHDIGDDETPSSAGDVVFSVGALHLDLGTLLSCGLFEDEQMRCWGAGAVGQTGYAMDMTIGDNELLDTLAAIMLGDTSTQFETGGTHTCAVLDNANVRCWGGNSYGQLGAGNTTLIGDDEHPSMGDNVALGSNDVSFVATGDFHSCAVTDMNDLFCWGWNSRGQLGYGSTLEIGDDEPPIMAGPVDVAFTGLAMDATITGLTLSYEHTCALFSTGDVGCWGANDVGQLGQGNTIDWGDTNNEHPSGLMLIDLGGTATSITAGQDFTCALFDDGSVHCWGFNGSGQLGLGHTNHIGDDEVPSDAIAVDLGGVAIQVSAAGLHACAVLEDFTVRCWGDGTSGQLGYGNTADVGDDEAPSAVVPVSVL